MTEITVLNGGKQFKYNTDERYLDIYYELVEHKFTGVGLIGGGILILDVTTPIILREVK